MARYHVNPHTGNPGQCSARISCPYGNLETDHFDSVEDARSAYEAGKLDDTFTTLSKSLDDVVGTTAARESDGEILAALEADPRWATFTPGTTFEEFTRKLDGLWDEDKALLEAIKASPEFATFAPGTTYEEFAKTLDDLEQREKSAFISKLTKAYEEVFAEDSTKTDETMDEMASYMEANPTVDVQGVNGKEPSYRVMANGQEAFVTYSADVARAAERAASAGEWSAMAAIDDESKWTRLNHEINRGADELANARQGARKDLAELKDATEPRLVEARRAAERDLRIQDVAFATLTDEQYRQEYSRWISSEGDEAPF